MFGPVIKGEKVDLVPVRKEDLERFVTWFEDTEVTRFMSRNVPTTIEDEAEWYETVRKSKDDVLWVITTKEGKRIGTFGLHGIRWINQRASVGIMIGEPTHWRKGIASETVKLGTAFAFGDLNLNSLHYLAATDNIGSWRAAEKAGFHFIGVWRQYFYRDGIWLDVKTGVILREDWEKANQA